MCFFFFLHRQGSPSPCIQTLIAQHVNRNALCMFKALNKCFTLYHVEGRLLKIAKISTLTFLLTVNNRRNTVTTKISRVGYLALVTGRVWLISY